MQYCVIFLGSTKDLWLTFSGQSKPAVKGFCNVDWEGKNTVTLFWAIHFTWEPEPFCGAQKSSI